MSKLCAVCCYSYFPSSNVGSGSSEDPLGGDDDPGTKTAIPLRNDVGFNRFCEQIYVTDSKEGSKSPSEKSKGSQRQWDYLLSDLESSDDNMLSVCLECRGFMATASEVREEIQELEVRLQEMQSKLGDCQNRYKAGMQKIGDAVKNADVTCLQTHIEKLPSKRNTVHIFRQMILLAADNQDPRSKLNVDSGNTTTVYLSEEDEDAASEYDPEDEEGDSGGPDNLENDDHRSDTWVMEPNSSRKGFAGSKGPTPTNMDMVRAREFLYLALSTDLSKMAYLKKQVFHRLVSRANKILRKVGNNFFFGYDKATKNVMIQGTEIIVCTRFKKMMCTKCEFSIPLEPEPGESSRVLDSTSIEDQILNHVLNQHLTTYRCSECTSCFLSYQACAEHGKTHKRKRLADSEQEREDEITSKKPRKGHTDGDISRLTVVPLDSLMDNDQDDEDDDDLQVLEEIPVRSSRSRATTFHYELPCSSLTNRESAMQFAGFMTTLDKSSVPLWKHAILQRILTRAMNILANEDDEYPVGDLRNNFFFDYNRDTGNVSVGGVDIIMNDATTSFDCSQCTFKIKINQGVHVEKSIHDHILGTHLKVYRCSKCQSTFASYGSYQHHQLRAHVARSASAAGWFACEFCASSFFSQAAVREHQEKCHKDRI